MLPSEFISSFEKQYPAQELSYILPKSLDKCPALKARIISTIESTHALTLKITDKNQVTYEMITRTYQTLDNPHMDHPMNNKGYEVMFEKLYKKYAGNLSPKSFAFIIDDLAELNPTMFAAKIVSQQGSYGIEKAVALNQAWMNFCLNYPTKFKMNYDEYNKVIAKLDEEESNDPIPVASDIDIAELRGVSTK